MKTPLLELFQRITSLQVGVIGDFAVDVYYPIEKDTGELSLETGKIVHRGGNIRTSLGAAGNVVNNFRALGVSDISVFGIRNEDLWGRELLHLLHQQGVNTDGLLVQGDNWQSCAYVKPMMDKEEDHRLDFGSYNETDANLLNQVLEKIVDALPKLDILLINQQFIKPLLNADAIKQLNQLSQQFTQCLFLADLRNLGQHIHHITLKANTVETARTLGITDFDERHTEQCIEFAQALNRKQNAPVLLTRGAYGMIYCEGDKVASISGIWHDGEIDSVGAGDTAISTFATCQAAQANIDDCLTIANAASAVTVRKLYQTGMANPQEIQSLLGDCSYVHYPYLAAHPENAKFYPNTAIEIVEDYSPKVTTKYVMMDHDGTISVLREGWESLMQPLMLRSIAGEALPNLSQKAKKELSEKIDQLISQTTGAPTIVQMEGLVDLVHREGYIALPEIKSAEDYKQQFLELLNEKVAERTGRFQRGELNTDDLTIKSVLPFLQQLTKASVELYLASGTDEANVVEEANTLGYASWFGGIHGARPNGESAKRKVLRYLLNEQDAKPEEIVVIGDGPSEIREGRKVGALCIGIASDEVHRYGLNLSKRERLIRAGAHLIIPDFAQSDALLNIILSD
ncbi:MAG: PfkB family carbohydrate kinase [Bacteroidota bacterium]